MSRKDSKGMFAAALDQMGGNSDAVPATRNSIGSPHLRKVAAGVRELQERSELASRMLNDSERVLEIDPAKILPSQIPDRFNSAYSDDALTEMIESMRERGQIVPGMVRPFGQSGQYQIVYGRRRLAAVKLLGQKFKATVRELSDEEAVVLQGEENAGREDLTFIEKCVFAHAQEQAAFKRNVICASLNTTKSHVSEMIKIASSIPADVLEAIGPAPSTGRGKWLALAALLESDAAIQATRTWVATKITSGMSSDDRFNAVVSAVSREALDAKQALASIETRKWVSQNGRLACVTKKAKGGLLLTIAEQDATRFGDWFIGNVERLYADFLKDTPPTKHGD
jgi:ParB family transcriptional regulator, chromosome partitioning protein